MPTAQGASDYVINFAQLTQRAGNFLVAREEMPAFTWDDLKGKNVLGGRKGGMPGHHVNLQHFHHRDLINIASIGKAEGSGNSPDLLKSHFLVKAQRPVIVRENAKLQLLKAGLFCKIDATLHQNRSQTGAAIFLNNGDAKT